MTAERIVLCTVWIVVIVSLAVFVPRHKRREAVIIHFADQLFTWSLSLCLVELGWNENPVREFVRAGSTNFTFNYALYPSMCVFYCLNYPQHRPWPVRLLYSALYAGVYTLFVVLVARYTDLIHPVHWRWQMNFLLGLTVFYIVYRYYRWYFLLSPGRQAGGEL